MPLYFAVKARHWQSNCAAWTYAEAGTHWSRAGIVSACQPKAGAKGDPHSPLRGTQRVRTPRSRTEDCAGYFLEAVPCLLTQQSTSPIRLFNYLKCSRRRAGEDLLEPASVRSAKGIWGLFPARTRGNCTRDACAPFTSPPPPPSDRRQVFPKKHPRWYLSRVCRECW
jgi:hypothetical protein